MRRIFALGAIAVFVGGLALAASYPPLPAQFKYEMATCPAGAGSRCVAAQTCSAGTCTAAAIPSGAADGMPLNQTAYFTIAVCAASGQTLSGAGKLQAYVYKYNAFGGTGAWMPVPDLDKSISVTGTTCAGAACQCQSWSELQTGFKGDRIRYMSNGVTVSGGSTLDVILEGQPVTR